MCTHTRAVVVPLVVLASPEWHYANELDQTHSRNMTGIQDVLGVETVVRDEEISESGSVIDLFANFWTCDGEGDLYLHGAVNYMYGFEAAYCPPIMIVDSPLEYDKIWVTPEHSTHLASGTTPSLPACGLLRECSLMSSGAACRSVALVVVSSRRTGTLKVWA
jgi:hypothetical protein